MVEMQFASNDGITYEGGIDDIIKLSKQQCTKLKFLALVTNASKIEKDGIEIVLEGQQEKAVMKAIQKITGSKKNNRMDIEKDIQEIIEKRTVMFLNQVQYEHMPDPLRNCIQKRIAVNRLLTAGRIMKFTVKVNPEHKQIQRCLVYTTESSIDSGKLDINFSQDEHIVILTANIIEAGTMTTFCAELMEIADNKDIDFSLAAMNCPCGGTTAPTRIDVSYYFDGEIVAVKNVPALKCAECGDVYDDALISIRTEKQAYTAIQESKSEIEF